MSSSTKNNLKKENKRLKKKNETLQKRMRELLEANRQLQKELEEKEEEEDQYDYPCDNCGIKLGEDVPIMCYCSKKEGDKTLCNECYYDCEMWKTDENEDNADEIEEAKRQADEPGESEDEEESDSDSESGMWSDKRDWMVHVNDYKEFFNKKYKNVNDEEWVNIYVREHWWENGYMFDIKWEGDEDGEMEGISNSSGFAAKMEEWVDEDDDEVNAIYI